MFKPSDEPNRQVESHHKDFGLIKIDQFDALTPVKTEQELRDFLELQRWRRVDHDDFAWASLENFWYVRGRYLGRENQKQSSFNSVLGRKADKSVKEKKGKRVVRWSDLFEDQNDEIAKWLAGRQQESKKVFSFKDPAVAQRTFGFVKPGLIDFDEMRRRLSRVWQNFQDSELQEGLNLLQDLLRNAGRGGTS